MKVLIFGATGGTGQQLVAQALTQGHEVTAFVRNPTKLKTTAPRLHIVKGDVLHYATVEKAMTGQEAVLCALGAPASDRTTMRADGTKHIIQAMSACGVRRLVCQTSLGFGDSQALLPFHFKYIVVPFILHHAFADHEQQERAIKESRLDWVIVRPGNMTNGARTGLYRHGFAGDDRSIKLKVSRADVADFMLKQLTEDRYLHQTPGISY